MKDDRYQIGNPEKVKTVGRMKVRCHQPVLNTFSTRLSVGQGSASAYSPTRRARSASRVQARPPPKVFSGLNAWKLKKLASPSVPTIRPL